MRNVSPVVVSIVAGLLLVVADYRPALDVASPALAADAGPAPVAARPVGGTFVELHGRLAVKGNRVVDEHGQSVVLRGMSLYWSQWKGQFYNPDAVKWLRDDWHCTVIRAAMAVGAYAKDPETEKRKVQTVVQAAIDLGIYVIIDWHTDRDNHLELAQPFFEEMARTYGDKPNVIFELWNEPLNKADWSTVIKPYHEAVIPKIRRTART